MQNQKGSATIIVFIVLLLTLGGVAWYFKSIPPENTDTSSWQTYRNEKYHYEIKYPSGTKIKEPRQDSRVGILTIGGIMIEPLKEGAMPQQEFLPQDFSQVIDYVGKHFPPENKYFETTFNGYRALWSNGIYDNEFIIVFNKSYVLLNIMYSIKNPEDPNYKKILTTFKFTE